MRALLRLHAPDFARCRAIVGAALVTGVIAGLAPASAGAVNVFTLDSGADGRAGVAVDGAGTGYFAWEHKSTSTSDVTQFCKVARGGTCTNRIVLPTPPLNPPPFDSTDVSAAFPVLGSGSTVFVVGPRFVAGDVVVWTSTDGGRSFGPAVQVTESGAYAGSDPTNALLAGAGFVISSHNAGLNFTSAQAGSTTAHGADLTPPGGLTNISGSTLGLAGGGAYGSPVEAFSLLNGSQPQPIDFRRYNGTGDPNDATSWSDAAQVTSGILPSLAGGPKGLFLASQDAANGTYTPVNVRKYVPGSGFGPPVTLQPDRSDVNAGSMFQTPGSGQLLVAWQAPALPDGGTGISLYRSTNGGASFASVGDVAEGTPNYAIYPDSIRIAAADNGQGFVSFVDYGAGQQLLRVADLHPIPLLAAGKPNVSGSTITEKVLVNTSGRLAATSRIVNGQALASTARARGCKKGQVRVTSHTKTRCVSDSFGARTLTVHAAGLYTVRLNANATAKRALNSGKTLRVQETLTFTAASRGKPIVKTFTITVHGKKAHKKH
jgi:VCBS repeat-containing protein